MTLFNHRWHKFTQMFNKYLIVAIIMSMTTFIFYHIVVILLSSNDF